MEQRTKKVKNTTIEAEDNKKLTLVLHHSLSIFELGADIKKYLHLNYEYLSKEELEIFCDIYEFPDYKVSLSMDEKTEEIVYDIRTDGSCIYQGKELIGMFYSDFVNLVDSPPDDIDYLYSCGPQKNGRNYDVYTYDSLGLMLWVWRGRIRTINIFSDEYMND